MPIGHTHLFAGARVGNATLLSSATAIPPASGGDLNKAATTVAIDTSGASLIVFAVSFNVAATGISITDSAGNTWPLAVSANDVVKQKINLYYCASPMTSTSHTFRFSTTNNSYPTVMIMAFSGTKLTSPLDVSNGTGNPASASSGTPGSILPTQNNDLIITACTAGGMAGSISAPTIGSPYTRVNAQDWIRNYKGAMAYNMQGGAASTNPTWTFNGTDTSAIVIAAFKTS